MHGDILHAFKYHPLGPIMYLGFTFVAMACLYGNIKGKRFMIDSKLANQVFIAFVSAFFLFGAIRMMLVTGYSGTAKEKIWRAALEQNSRAEKAAEQNNVPKPSFQKQ